MQTLIERLRIDFGKRTLGELIQDREASAVELERLTSELRRCRFEELKKFAQSFTAEEQQGIAAGLSEEELALFDILTKPEPVLTKAEEAEVKRVCRELLETLKREKLVPDWREKQQAKASVLQNLRTEMRGLPPPYTKDLRAEKLARTFAHVYEHYSGPGQSVYEGLRAE